MNNKTLLETTDTKWKILRAAAHIINTIGVSSLTLEAVAKEAQISKGGLLYHYSSKDALLEGMNAYLMQGYVDDVERIAKEDPCEQGKWSRAYILKTFNHLNKEFDMNVAFMSAVATNPKWLKAMTECLQVLQVRMENDHLDPTVSTIIRLAVDGIYFNHLYGMDLNEDVREKVLRYLISLTEEHAQ